MFFVFLIYKAMLHMGMSVYATLYLMQTKAENYSKQKFFYLSKFVEL